MTATVIALAIAAAYALIALGWGGIFRRVVRLEQGHIAVDMALGLAALTFIGGILNLARVAVPVSLAVLASIGAVFALPRLYRAVRGVSLRGENGSIVSGVIVLPFLAASVVFVAATLVPPSEMNTADDLLKYLAHIERMLQTGTLYGSPLNALGMESLGGQPFLQGFVASVAPLAYVNAFDALFCFSLCVALAGSLAPCEGRWAPVTALAVIAVVVIDPQYVNISSVYSGAALVLALFALLAVPVEQTSSRPLARAFAAGMIAASMIALKPTFLFIVTVMLASGAMGVAVAARKIRKAFSWCVAAGCGFLLGLLPWLALYAPYYLEAMADPAQRTAPPQVLIELIDLFSTAPLFYGANGLAYTLALAVPLSIGGMAIFRWRHLDGSGRGSTVIMMLTALGAFAGYFFVIFALGPKLSGYHTALRYYTPVIIAVVPASLALGTRYIRATKFENAAIAVYTLLGCAVLALFLPSFAARIGNAYETGNVLAFRASADNPEYRSYYNETMSDGGAETVRKMQSAVPAGVPILAWTNAPFRLDYRRNPIYDVTYAGLTAPWAYLPAANYVIWDYKSVVATQPDTLRTQMTFPAASDRLSSQLALQLMGVFYARLKSAPPDDILYDDGKVVVFRAADLPRDWSLAQ